MIGERIKKIVHQPIFLVLLPIFFVLHGYIEYFEYINGSDIFILCLFYIALTVVIAFVCWFLFRNRIKTALFAFTAMSFFFFFGAFYSFAKKHIAIHLVSRLGFLLPAIAVFLIILFVILKRTKKSLLPVTSFLNLLFISYCLIDAAELIMKALRPTNKQQLLKVDNNFEFRVCDTCARPDIYLLVFDEYASSISLEQQYHYKNNLDSVLVQNNFKVLTNSHANYNYTNFAMASMLSMSYLTHIKNTKAINGYDYANCNVIIRENLVAKLLNASGYKIVNYSLFDLQGHPAMEALSPIPLKTKLITNRTLTAQVYKNMGWLIAKWYPFKLFFEDPYTHRRTINSKYAELVKESATKKDAHPRFIYAHFLMPHPPFFYDKNGNPKDIKTVYKQSQDKSPIKAYLDYLPYVNRQIEGMIAAIMRNNPDAVIIVMGDHGFRPETTDSYPYHHFQNLNAVYYPDQDYRLLYDSISGVNQFRVVFNKLFHQSMPLLKDTSIYIVDDQNHKASSFH